MKQRTVDFFRCGIATLPSIIENNMVYFTEKKLPLNVTFLASSVLFVCSLYDIYLLEKYLQTSLQ